MSSAQPRPSCADTVHELCNVMTAVLMSSQVLDWKLPPYSRLKRPVREIERNAQRGGELLKRLQRQLVPVASPEGSSDHELCRPAPSSARKHGDGEAQEPGASPAGQAKLPPAGDAPAAPGLAVAE